jgi:DNA-binding MarR family transcriptional regulator
MNKQQISERAGRLEGAMRGLKWAKFMAKDDSGLKPSEKYVLFVLATLNDGGPVMPSEVAKKLDVTLGAMTHHINSFEKQGLVIRSDSPNDRRVTLINLSEKGVLVTEALRKKHWKKICGLIEYLGDKDSEQLIALMEKITDYAKKDKG